MLLARCYENPTYLDRYHSLHPGRLPGSKRLIVLAPDAPRSAVVDCWRREVSELAVVVGRDAALMYSKELDASKKHLHGQHNEDHSHQPFAGREAPRPEDPA
jgi:hypothetical protein